MFRDGTPYLLLESKLLNPGGYYSPDPDQVLEKTTKSGIDPQEKPVSDPNLDPDKTL